MRNHSPRELFLNARMSNSTSMGTRQRVLENFCGMKSWRGAVPAYFLLRVPAWATCAELVADVRFPKLRQSADLSLSYTWIAHGSSLTLMQIFRRGTFENACGHGHVQKEQSSGKFSLYPLKGDSLLRWRRFSTRLRPK